MPFGDWNTSEYWDATANKPKLTSGKGIHGQGYLVGQSGMFNLDGNTSWQVGDIAIFLLDKWVKITNGLGGSANPAGTDGDIQIKSGTSLAAITRAGGASDDYLGRDNTYKSIPGGASFTGTGDPGLTRAQHITTTYTSPPNVIRTSGYDTPGDWGGGTYLKVNAQPDHKGWFKTADNTYYELYPVSGFVLPQQFGGKNTAVYNDRFPDIGPACNDAVDYIVFNRFAHVELFLVGNMFIATTVQLKGASFNVRGLNGQAGSAGTFIMPDYYVTGFVGHHGLFSFEAFGSIYFNNRDVMLGEMVYSASALGTKTYICSQAGHTSADGSQKPTGTGTGLIDGTAKWDYYREATRVELTSTAWGGEVSHIQMYSHYDQSAKTGGSWLAQTNAPAVGPWSQKPSGLSAACGPWKPAFGFLGRVRAHVHHCWMGGFSAEGAAFISNGDFDFPTITGNVNYWAITDCQFYYNTMDGMHNSYSDGNAGYAAHIDVSSNGRWGYRNQGFLGDGIYGIQSAFDGRASIASNQRFPTSVAHAGYYYYAKLGYIGVSATPDYGAIAPTPGASNAAWELLGGDGTWVTDNWNYPDWVSGNTYEAGGAFGSDNVNARHRWDETYIEGGTWPAQFNSRDVVIGGLLQGLFIGAGANLLQDGSWYQSINYTSRAHNFSASFGGGGPYGDGVGEGIFNFFDGVKNYSFRTDSYENSGATFATDNFAWAIDRYRAGFWIRSGQTGKFYGEPTALTGGQFALHELYVGSDGDCRKLDYADSKPTDGTGGRGHRVYNRQADVGQVEGWICCGTGRVWKNMRTIT